MRRTASTAASTATGMAAAGWGDGLDEDGEYRAPVPDPANAPALDRRILEELIYERVRVAIDLCELVTFEEDLAMSIARALERCSRSQEERSDLTLEYLHRAWERITDDVFEGLATQAAATGPDGAGGRSRPAPAARGPGRRPRAESGVAGRVS